jgi:hypothetical protein
MNVTSGLVAVALAVTCACGPAAAQTEAPTPKATTNAETASTTYRLTYSVTELDGAKRLGTQHFSLTLNSDSGNSQLKLGSRVPIATGMFNQDKGATLANTQFQYVDVGLNITARVHEFAAGVEVYSKFEQSSVAEEQSIGRNDPVIRQAELQNTALLIAGKPVVLGSLDVPGSTRHLDIEVVLEVVK